MKKFIPLIIALVLSLFTYSQTFLTEDFYQGIMPPTGWTIDNLASQWDCHMSNNSGGSAPEARFSYINSIQTSRLISPQIDLSGITSVTLQFSHFLDDWAHKEGYTLGVATRSGTGQWNSVWQINPTEDVGPETLQLTINNSDVGASDFQFCLFVGGNLYNFNYWYIDDISLFQAFDLDGEIQRITTYPFVLDSVYIEGVVVNKGFEEITSVEISWQANNNEVFTTSFDSLSIDRGETYEFTCDGIFHYPIGTYSLRTWLSKVNGTIDDNPVNDTIIDTLSVVSHTSFKKPLFEEFASSKGSLAKAVNSNFVPWCNERSENMTLLKYPFSRPLHDPYYIEDCEAREEYYGLQYLDVFILQNAIDVGLSMNLIENQYEEEILKPGFANIIASRTSVSRSTVMEIDVTILPFAHFDSHRLFVAVFENVTEGNVGGNGETEFYNQLMAMVPDPYGTELLLHDRQPVTISQSFDLSGTNIEEWDDLGVAIFIQDYDSREVFQSTYAVENANFATNATLLDLQVNGSSISGFSPDQFEYNIELPVGTTVVPETIGIPTDENATVIELPAHELPGTTTIEVFAEDLTTKLIYTVNYTVLTSTDQQEYPDIKVYPNPTQGHLSISGVMNASVTIYSASGSHISTYDDYNGEALSIAAYPKGIYIARIQTNELSVTRRIVVR